MIEWAKGIPLVGHLINATKFAFEALSSRAGCDVEIKRDPELPTAHNHRYNLIVHNRRNKKRLVRVLIENFGPLGDSKKTPSAQELVRHQVKFPVELGVTNLSEYVLLPNSPTIFSFCKISSYFDNASIRIGIRDKDPQMIFPKVKSTDERGIFPQTFEPITCVICVELDGGKKEKRFTFELTPRKYTRPTDEEEPKSVPLVELLVKRL